MFWLLPIAACTPSEPEPVPGEPVPGEPAPETGTPVVPPTFAGLAEAGGYVVQYGAYRRLEEENCCAPGATCLFNNPSSPYLMYTLPRAPGQTVLDPNPSADGLSTNYHLRADEAVVLLGRTPPQASYYGSSSYVGYRIEGLEILASRGSTGPSLNHLVVAARHGAEGVFDAPIAVVTTMDAAVERRVVDWLLATGWDPDHVHADRIPLSLVRPGLGLFSDTFANVFRVAVFQDPVAGEAWLENPQTTILRLTPSGPEAVVAEPHPLVPMPEPGTGGTEEAWRPAVDALGAAIKARYPDTTVVEDEGEPQFVEPYTCIDEGFCAFDISDRYYARTVNLFLTEGSFFVAYGVNHQRTGKSAYSNVTVNEVAHQLGIVAVEDPEFVGTARTYLPDEPLVDDLYVVHYARDCDAFPAPCVEIGRACPGADDDEALFLSYRAYLEPASGAGPLASELVLDRAVKFFPVLPTSRVGP